MKNRFLMVFRVCKKNMVFKIGKVLRLVFFTLAPGCGHQVPAPGPLVPGTRSSGPGDQVPAAGDLVLGPVEDHLDYLEAEPHYNVACDQTPNKNCREVVTTVRMINNVLVIVLSLTMLNHHGITLIFHWSRHLVPPAGAWSSAAGTWSPGPGDLVPGPGARSRGQSAKN